MEVWLGAKRETRKMSETQTLYRVVRDKTHSYQAGSRAFHARVDGWQRDILYCGYDRAEAFRVYWNHEPENAYRGPGNLCIDVGVEVIDDDEAAIAEAEPEEIAMPNDPPEEGNT